MMSRVSMRRPSTVDFGGLFVVGILGLSALTSTAIAWNPTLAFVPLALVVAAYELISARVRLIVVVFGGMAVLQSSQGLSLPKVAYLAGAVLAVGASLSSIDSPAAIRLRSTLSPLFRMSIVFIVMIVASFGTVIVTPGATPYSWLRDVAPYLFLAAVPVLAADARLRIDRTSLETLFVIAGAIASIAFCLEWLGRRGYAGSLGHFALPTGTVGGALFCYAVSCAYFRRGESRRWLLLAGAVLTLQLVTGTRSALFTLLALTALLFDPRHSMTQRVLRVGGIMIALVAVLSVAGVLLASTGDAHVGQAAGRIASVPRLVYSLKTDQSFQERSAATKAAWAQFTSEPLLGSGPGRMFQWTNGRGETKQALVPDTPVSFPAKFGLVGLVVVVVVLWTGIAFLRRLPADSGSRPARTALIAFAITLIAGAPLGSPFDDKGVAFGALFLLALALPDSVLPRTVRGRD